MPAPAVAAILLRLAENDISSVTDAAATPKVRLAAILDADTSGFGARAMAALTANHSHGLRDPLSPAIRQARMRLASEGVNLDSDMARISDCTVGRIFHDRHVSHAAAEAYRAAIFVQSNLQPTEGQQACCTSIPCASHRVRRNEWNIQAAARLEQLTGWQVAYMIQEVFEEHSIALSRDRSCPLPNGESWLQRTFANRCHRADISWLSAQGSLDRSSKGTAGAGAPRAIIRQAKMNPDMAAAHGELIAERSIRVMVASFIHSWKSVMSGIRSWADWVDVFHPGQAHFPALPDQILAYTAVFQNDGTLANYLGHIKAAHDLLRMPISWTSSTLSRLRRGASKLTFHKVKPRIRMAQTRKLAEAAIALGDTELADVIAVSRQLLARVQSEVFPLQLDGAMDVDLDSDQWHSRILFHDCPGVKSLSIILRKRKNTSQVSTHMRSCCCASEGPVLCGVCALYRYRHIAKPGHQNHIFSIRSSQAMTRRLLAAASRAGIPAHQVSWHGFRRGKASDMLAGGTAISTILAAGGWKSPAILRYLVAEELDHRVAAITTIDDSDSAA